MSYNFLYSKYDPLYIGQGDTDMAIEANTPILSVINTITKAEEYQYSCWYARCYAFNDRFIYDMQIIFVIDRD